MLQIDLLRINNMMTLIIDDQALNNQQVTTMHHACMLKDPVSLLWYEGGSETPATCQCYD